MNMLDDVEFKIAKLALGPDDLLAVRAAKPITSVIAAELRAQLERLLNLPGRVLVVDSGVESSVVTSATPTPAGAVDTKAAAQVDARPTKASGKA